MDWLFWPQWAIGALLGYQVFLWIYNLYLHPLRKIPGRRRDAASVTLSLYPGARGKSSWLTHRLHQKYGSIVRIAPNQVSFISPSAWKEIYAHKRDDKDVYHKDYNDYIQGTESVANILFSTHDKHSRMRKLLNPAFADRALRNQEQDIQHQVDLFISGLRRRSGSFYYPAKDGLVDIRAWYEFIVYDIITYLLLGESLGCLKQGNYHPRGIAFYKSMKHAVYIGLSSQMAPLDWLLQLFIPKSLHNYYWGHIKFSQEQARWRITGGVSNLEDDIVSYMLRSDKERPVSEAELEDNINVFLVAGSDTVSVALGSATHYLMQYPDAYVKLAAEIREAFTEESGITMAETAKLKYLDAVIKESMRMHGPVGGGLQRMVPKGGREIDGVWMPAETTVFVSHLAAARSALNFTDPDTFVPERWLGDPRYASDHRDACYPFSRGPRNCIGQNLALAEMRLTLCRLLWNFDLLPQTNEADWEDQFEYGLWESTPLYVKLVDRFDGK